MGKKNKRNKERQEPGKNIQPGKEKSSVASQKGLFSMTNWLVLLILILPFLVSAKPLDPVLTPRYIFLSSFMLLFILFFFLYRKNKLNISSGLVKIVFGLGIAFGAWSFFCLTNAINYRESYFPVSRHLLYLILLFVVMTAVSNEEMQAMKLCKAITVVALLQSLVGIFQYYDLAFTEIPGNFKPYGLMANRNFFGSAQAFVLPFCIFVLYVSNKTWKIISSFALAGIVISIVISQTRSAWLASAAIFIVSFFLILIFSKAQRKKWIIGSLISIGLTTGIVSLLLFSDKGGELSRSVSERAISLTGRSDQTTMESFNIAERLKLWDKTTDIIKDKPVTGIGPGNWKIALPAYGTSNLIFAKGGYSPDFPHNVYLQTASETGIPGAIFYFGMWLVIAFLAIQTIIKTHSDKLRLLVILMLSGLCSVAVDFMFSFPTERMEHMLYMYVMGGIILGCYSNLQNTSSQKPVQLNRKWLIPVLGIISFNLFLGTKKYNFEKHWKLAKEYKRQGSFREAIEEANAGKNAFATLDIAGSPIEIFSTGAYKGMKNYDLALKEISKAAIYNPNDAKIYNEWGTLYTDLGQYDKAIFYYNKALKLAPGYEIVLKNLAVNYFNVGNNAACIDALSKVKMDGDADLIGLMNEAKRRLLVDKK